jgi:hypothetical protein
MNALKIIMLLLAVTARAWSQDRLEELTIENIMRDPKWMGTAPSDIQWAPDSKSIYFKWNPDSAPGDSLYVVTLPELKPLKLTGPSGAPGQGLSFNTTFTNSVYEKDGDLFLFDNTSSRIQQITNTTIRESSPRPRPPRKARSIHSLRRSQ